MTRRRIVTYILFFGLSFCAGIAGAFVFYKAHQPAEVVYAMPQAFSASTVNRTAESIPAGVDFVAASKVARPSVVYIKVLSTAQQQSYGWDPFWDFFGNIGPVSSSGSGVIVSQDGYIITNSHVVANATKIEVVLNDNRRSFEARVVGSDPSSDLALLKVEAEGLPVIEFTNSDDLQIGEWVLAVGNPFNLTSSVTAGIVSARGRNINIVKNQFPIESFIQTDAAINPGNSGGALVNSMGKLVGINTAILSKTGSYTGYGFAIPTNIVRKVIKDIKEFGFVHRAFLEAEVVDIDDQIAKKTGSYNNGVYVQAIIEGGNASKAGIRQGDVIIQVNGKPVDSRAVFDEHMAYYRPGDKITMLVKRGSEALPVEVTLTNKQGTISLQPDKSIRSSTLGADFEQISKIEKQKYGVEGGIRISNIGNGQIRRMNLPEGFVVLAYNGKTYAEPETLIKDMENSSGRIKIDGINPDGSRGSYSFYFY